MKKYIALALAIITLTVIICSCSKNTKPVETETDENGEIITTTTTKEQATTKNTSKETTSTTKKNGETTKKNDTFEFPEDHYIKTGTIKNSSFTELPSRILINATNTGTLQYYSKNDKSLYTFCFDPLCDHKNLSCTAICFSNPFSPAYSPYNNRLYFIRGENIFSMKFDGTDIKLDVSLGEHGKDLTAPKDNEGMSITDLQTYNNYLYFVCASIVNSGKSSEYKVMRSLYRYNLQTNKLENLSELSGYDSTYFREYFVGKNKIYFTDVTSDGARFCSANHNMTNIREITASKDFTIGIGEMIFDGDKFFTVAEKTENGTSVMCLISFDPETDKIVEVERHELKKYQLEGASYYNNTISLLFVTDEYIYYSAKEDPFFVGKYNTRNGERYEYNYYHRIYKINKLTGEKTLSFEGVTSKDPKTDSYMLDEIYISNSKVIAAVTSYKYSTPRKTADGFDAPNWQRHFYASFDIDENGNFVNMHELELDIDE